MTSASQKMEFAYVMGKHSPLALGTIKRLLYYAATHQRLEIAQCNRELSVREQAKLAKVRADIALMLEGTGVRALFGGDPRGATVKLIVADGFTNDFGGEGVCVPA